MLRDCLISCVVYHHHNWCFDQYVDVVMQGLALHLLVRISANEGGRVWGSSALYLVSWFGRRPQSPLK